MFPRGAAGGGSCSPQRTPHSSVRRTARSPRARSEEHTSELQSLTNLVCRLLLEKKNKKESESSALGASGTVSAQHPSQGRSRAAGPILSIRSCIAPRARCRAQQSVYFPHASVTY